MIIENRKRNIAIFLFDDVEVLDFAGSFEVFSTAGVGIMDEVPFHVFIVAQKSQVIARNNLVVLPTYTFERGKFNIFKCLKFECS